MDADSEMFAVYAAQRGCEWAWRRLFEWHFDGVYRFCIALAAGRTDVAEEVTQQAFVVASQRIHRFDPDRAGFRAWLLGIAKNRHMAIRTSERIKERHEESSAKEHSEAFAREEPDLQVHETLARLPYRYRIVLEAKYIRGLSLKEISSNNGASIDAVESLLRRARANFARVYEKIRALD
jgi:RNA polymerase sigma-70 factor (ECF subfamily)